MGTSDLLHSKSVLIAAGIGTAAAIAVSSLILYNRRNKFPIPQKWIYVGDISDIISYPIKSCGPIRYSSVNCTVLGIEHENLYDRTFMIVDADGNFITARKFPMTVTIMPAFKNGALAITAPNMPEIEVPLAMLQHKRTTKTTIWSIPIDSVDCGDVAAEWFSQYILHEKTGLRLVHFPSKKPVRPITKQNLTNFPEYYTQKDVGALQDESSYMVFNQSSVDDLNSKLSDPISILQFRPNFIVKGPKPFEEDAWKWMIIGDDVMLKYVRPCSRCVLTQVTPEGKRRDDGEPLTTLRKYRLREITGNSPILGVHLGLVKPGFVKVGDPVYVPKL